MRALLKLLCENEATVPGMLLNCLVLLRQATTHLKILDPELGEEELISSVQDQTLNLRLMSVLNKQDVEFEKAIYCEVLGQLGQDEPASG